MKKLNKIRLKTVDSTNNYAKTLIKYKKDVNITAKVQTGGRGREDRLFQSQKGGLYFTGLKFYKDFYAGDVFRLMINASMAVVETLKAFNVDAAIKWPNDIYVNGKKICGILIENTFLGDRLDCSITGIGININNLLENKLKKTATSLKELTGRRQSIAKTQRLLIKNLDREYSLDEYRARSYVLGKSIEFYKGGVLTLGRAVDIDGEGGLTVDCGGCLETLKYGEISIRRVI